MGGMVTMVVTTAGMTMALSACGSHNGTTPDGAGGAIVTRSDGNGGTMTAHIPGENGTPVPSDLPKWAPAFPGSKVAQVMVQNDKGTSIKSVVLTTSQDMKTVASFYTARIAAAGITPTMAQDSPDGSMRVIESASGAKDMLMVGRSDDSTSITVTYTIKR